MTELISIELYKIFRKWRSYIGFIVVGLLVALIEVATMLEGSHTINSMTRNLQQSFVMVGNLLNAYFISYFILNSLVIHIPFLITLVAGDLMAGEATAGTYRLLISRPVSRFQVVLSKFIAGLTYTFLLILWMAVVSLGLGALLLGFGEMLVFQGGTIIIFPQNDVFWRFLLAYGFAVLSMGVVASLAFLFSTLVENAIGPIISTMAVIIVFIIISAIDVSVFQTIKPFLFTNYMNTWRAFFDKPMDTAEIIKSVLVLLTHVVLFFGAAAYIFQKKDILT